MNLILKILFVSGLSYAALDAGDSQALLYIDFVAPSNSSPVTITLSGTFNRANAGTSSAAIYNSTVAATNAGIQPGPTNPDILRFTALPTGTVNPVAGQRFAFNIPRNTNPFTGVTSPANNFASSIIDSNYNTTTGPFFSFAFGTGSAAGAQPGTFWLSNNYTDNEFINRTLTFSTLSLTQIGLLRGTPDIAYTLGSGPNQEQVILRVSPVPGPLPILGAATAFGYSRRLRKKIRNRSKFQQAQQP
jgi:hypothetical protein